jgi:2-iminobutanoate/2-iminopropanoate deaminase
LRERLLANDICHVYLVNDVAKRALLNLLARMIEEQAWRSRLVDSSEREVMTGSETEEMPITGGHYSHAMRAGDFVYTAGQVPRDSKRNVIGSTIEEQTAAALENVGRVLKSFGATFDNVVKATVHLSDVANAPRFNAVYARYFPNNRPVRTLTGSQLNGVLVEVDVVAYLGPIAVR